MTGSGPLAGRGVLVTRPAHQAASLAAMIREAGGRPILFPVLEILDTARPQALEEAIARLDGYQLAVFVSPNAVSRAMACILARRGWPAGLRAATVGKASAAELRRHGVASVIVPEGRFDSEALLGLPALNDIAGCRVVVFRGDGGRELLGDTLRARGAQVDYVECYRRAVPAADPAPLLRAWTGGTLQAVTATSSEGLRNLHAMVGTAGRAALLATPLFVPHERIGEAARELGFDRVIVTAAGDDGLLQGLVRHFSAG